MSDPMMVGMKAGLYKPSGFNLNVFLHQVAALFHEEFQFSTYQVDNAIIMEQSVIVPDTSVYDDAVDFVAMKEAGAAGVFVRAGQGLLLDNQFSRSQVETVRADLPDGYYWFLDPRVDPKRQAEMFWGSVKGQSGKLPLVVDYEAPDSWGGNFGGWKNLYAFLERMKTLTSREVIIYTGYYYWQEHSPNPLTQTASLNYFAQYPLWLAWYTADVSVVRIPKPWTTLLFLQYTESGKWPLGQDLSYFNGDRLTYLSRFNLDILPTPQPVPLPSPGIDYENLYNKTAADLNNKNYALSQIQKILDGLKG